MSAALAQISAHFKACGDLKVEPAIQVCTRVIESKGAKVKLKHAYFNRGVAWSGQNKYDLAIADYTAAIKIEPKYREAYNNRGNAYRRKGDHALAIADYTEAIKLNPKRESRASTPSSTPPMECDPPSWAFCRARSRWTWFHSAQILAPDHGRRVVCRSTGCQKYPLPNLIVPDAF